MMGWVYLFFLVAFRLVAGECMGVGRQQGEVDNQRRESWHSWLLESKWEEGKKPDLVDLFFFIFEIVYC